MFINIVVKVIYLIRVVVVYNGFLLFVFCSDRVVTIDKNWVDHRTLALSMKVYGYVNQYVIDVFGKLLLIEQFQNPANQRKPSRYNDYYSINKFYLSFFVLKIYHIFYLD